MLIPNKSTEEKEDFKLEIEAISDKGIKYLITFITETNSCLIIKAINKENIFDKIYSNKFSIEKIKDNKYMNMYDDMKEICLELSERIKVNSLKIKENDNKTLIIIISPPNAKVNDILFKLDETEQSINDNIYDLKKIVLELKNENGLL